MHAQNLDRGGTRQTRAEPHAHAQGNPVNELIKTVLLEERTAESVYRHETYQLKWTLVNEFDLVFVVVYAGAVTMLLVDELLESLKAAFIKLYKDSIVALPTPARKYDFEKEFQKIMQRHEQKVLEWRNRGQKTFDDTDLAKDIRAPNSKLKKEEPKKVPQPLNNYALNPKP
jgi:hypothetical protein